MRRRRTLAACGAFVGTAVAGAVSRPTDSTELVAKARDSSDESGLETNTETLLPETVHETTLYEIDAPRDGPTAMIFGGVHGDEYNGIDIAHEVVDWAPDAGTLVVVPETDRVAVENDEREGVDGDLNRQFPAEEGPTSDLAAGIWDAIERHDPDVVLDLHRSLGLYGVHQQYVGQALFYSPGADGASIAATLNDEAVPWYLPMHRFVAHESHLAGPLLFHETARELDTASYLFETTSFLLDRETRNEMTRIATAAVLDRHGLLEEGR
ncbi:succinylglutamate desuccinylase/aspartoacylase family protein [Natronococcus sp. A-GB1]|uniref:succinylglutamate desuccinylase/aspartoacylase family protein n=1 Tax=Natronococcus sp. A-GB1 TaxID=3037648 RepID=UPI00241E5807|nr:succinylglutamate desuccinylase/aspartoacylase family protein [Natronococcus sp. A-GB1]MDG5761188.1 succinylglutamate desuccinylase/aspartoacylase family protein [Natronococcus sp. A-GB1]